MKLLLFDIDGTLLRGGPARESFRCALVAVYRTAGGIDGYPFSGKTDGQIARELLRGAGLTDAEIDAAMPALWETYLAELKSRLEAMPMHVLPGVRELLGALEERSDLAYLGLVTGNLAGGARLKLESAGLAGRFPVGGYGSDSESRDELPPIAIGRAAERWGVRFAREDVVLIGDTPLDIASGRAHSVRSVAVATGRFDADALREAGADHVLDDLSDTERVLDLLIGWRAD
ncbi:MAG: haloacid dehalogenase-like hydrolase [Gemmatimonadetes bacterium]|nr:haloacid dehalogenase-like hydrolase [Gemmatimonadota bacterium]